MDRATEAIAHFIGLFAVAVEDTRDREAFEKFKFLKDETPDPQELPSVETAFSAPYKMVQYHPGFTYEGPAPTLEMCYALSSVEFDPPEVSVAGTTATTSYPDFHAAGILPAASSDDTIDPPETVTPPGSEDPTSEDPTSETLTLEIEPLGSVANFVNQAIELSDDDYFGVGGHDLQFSPTPIDDTQIMAAAGEASALSPFAETEMPGSTAELKAFVANAVEAIETYEPASPSGTTVFAESAPSIEGTYVNGIRVDEAPDIEDHFSLDEKLEAAPYVDQPFQPNTTLTENGYEVDVSVRVDAGANVLINDAVLESYWTAASVTAVVGDHVEINAVVQVNAWYDSDTVTSAVENWAKDAADTHAFNIATFERYDTLLDDDDVEAEASFPEYYAIEKITGDLVIASWLEQFIFMSDNDIGILSSSGATTYVYSGGNIDYNGMSLSEYGFSYDLIIIGGNEYDVSIIEQVNLLYDNDLIGAVSGFESTGDGSYSTSDNLLWNNAYVYNVGSADRFESLSEDYQEAADSLAGGADSLNSILSDPAFAGYQALSVLYITGDLINVQYVSQTSILGDSDQIALAMDAIEPYVDAEWSVSTGSNVLINNAAIIDLDSFGETLVGGSQYSQDVLVQVDIISAEPELWAQNPDVLVNEAIAFLDDEVTQADSGDYLNPGNLDPENSQGDSLQTLIG